MRESSVGGGVRRGGRDRNIFKSSQVCSNLGPSDDFRLGLVGNPTSELGGRQPARRAMEAPLGGAYLAPPVRYSKAACQPEFRVGSGSFGTVYIAVDRLTQKTVAIKKQPYGSQSARTEHAVYFVLRAFPHPNVQAMLDYYIEGASLHLVFEHAPSNLWWLSQSDAGRRGMLPRERVRGVVHGLTRGVGHCHDLQMAHGDLSLANVLLDGGGKVLLADFGYAACMHDTVCRQPTTTPYARAPEGWADSPKRPGAPGDCWAVGVACAILLAGGQPFLPEPGQRAIAEDDMEAHCMGVIFQLLGEATAANWPGYADLRWRDPGHSAANARAGPPQLARFLAQKFADHGWQKDPCGIHVCTSLLKWDPGERATLVQLQRMPEFQGIGDGESIPANAAARRRHFSGPSLADTLGTHELRSSRGDPGPEAGSPSALLDQPAPRTPRGLQDRAEAVDLLSPPAGLAASGREARTRTQSPERARSRSQPPKARTEEREDGPSPVQARGSASSARAAPFGADADHRSRVVLCFCSGNCSNRLCARNLNARRYPDPPLLICSERAIAGTRFCRNCKCELDNCTEQRQRSGGVRWCRKHALEMAAHFEKKGRHAYANRQGEQKWSAPYGDALRLATRMAPIAHLLRTPDAIALRAVLDMFCPRAGGAGSPMGSKGLAVVFFAHAMKWPPAVDFFREQMSKYKTYQARERLRRGPRCRGNPARWPLGRGRGHDRMGPVGIGGAGGAGAEGWGRGGAGA